jgi:hypothetical protein
MSLKTPIDLVEKRNAIFNMLRRARLYYSSGDERAALFTLHNAVASTLSLLCEAEGINWRDIGMRGMVWELKRRPLDRLQRSQALQEATAPQKHGGT